MRINSLSLLNYRNYDSLKIVFHENLNVIYGKNGQGKTNLVEAIAYLSTLKSFRLHQDSDLIKQNTFFFSIEAKMTIANRNSLLRCNYSSKEKKMYYNQNEVNKVREFIGISNTVTFASSDIFLFKDNPKRRRYFIDSELSKISPSYLYSLLKYQKLLKERNELLKLDNINKVHLNVLTNLLSQQVLMIITKRIDFLKLLETKVTKKYQEYSEEKNQITLRYLTDFAENSSIKDITAKYEESLEKDIYRKVTQIGPHKDDLQVCIDSKDIEIYGSQGQQRLAAIALKFALVEVVENQIGENPIVIFDDVMSDLDENKRKKLLSSLTNKMQVFITSANVNEIKKFINGENLNYYLVENGSISLTEGS
jgi:DNA replication and repair protein RecF